MDTLDLNRRTFQDKTDGQVIYTGPSVPSLGISQGDSLSSVLNTILSNMSSQMTLKQIEDTLIGLSSDELQTTAPTYDLGSASSASAAAIANKGMGYEVKEDGGFTAIDYNMQDTSSNLPDGYKVVTSGATAQGTGNQSLLVSTTGTAGTMKILPSQFPVRVNFRIGINTPQGDIALIKSETLQAATPTVRSTSLAVEDLTTPADSFITQKEFNTRMSSEVSRLKQKVDELERNGK